MSNIRILRRILAASLVAAVFTPASAWAMCATDTDCQDGLFCNGEETCDPMNANADSEGCVASTVFPSPDDGIDCTFDSCDEGADETDNMGSFKNVEDNGACDDMDPCTADVCTAGTGCSSTVIGCTIDETCYLDTDLNPFNSCQVCDIAQSETDWTATNAGNQCADPSCSADGASIQAASICDDQGGCIPGDATLCTNGCNEAICRDECSSDDDCPSGWCNLDDDRQCTTTNRAPVARAGDDQSVDSGLTVTLDGSGSFDPDADLVSSYRWTQSRGPTVRLDDAGARKPTFTAPRVRDGDELPELVFALVVSDGELDSDPSFTKVTVNPGDNAAPVASITGPSGVDAGVSLTLDGSDSTDPDGDAIESYTWTQTGGPDAMLGATDQATLQVTLPDAIGETVTFTLVVSDGVSESDPATLNIELLEPLEQPGGGDGGGDGGGGVAHGANGGDGAADGRAYANYCTHARTRTRTRYDGMAWLG